MGDRSELETASIRYLIVAHHSFRGQLDTLVHWKQRKGFLTDIVYTDNPAVGTSANSIADYIRSQYTQATVANPAPTYLLLVGDVQQIPSFQGMSAMTNHVSDLYYACWTEGDHIPDCHYGRFSAQNVNQLLPQIEKTLMYEQYAFEDPSFLNNALLVSGIDNSTSTSPTYAETYADPAMDYIAKMYVNSTYGYNQVPYFKNVTTVNPNAPGVNIYSNVNSASSVRNYLNAGTGMACHSGHGTADGWFSPSFQNNNANAMTNAGRFGVMIGNCCLSNKFDDPECLGEALLRKGNNSGAVAYIGATNQTHWMQDFHFAVGIRANIYNAMIPTYDYRFLGAYDRMYHTHNEAYSSYCQTMGSMIMAGDMAIETSTTTDADYKHYYWEIYQLMGDPSLTPWLKQATPLTPTLANEVSAGDASIVVNACPYAFVALTQVQLGERVLLASAFANSNGTATLHVSGGIFAGNYELTSSAQNRQTAFIPVTVQSTDAANVEITSLDLPQILVAGDSLVCRVNLHNSGYETARHCSVSLTTNFSAIPTLSQIVDSLPAGASTYVDFQFQLPGIAIDQSQLACRSQVNWDFCLMPSQSMVSRLINAPNIVFTLQTEPAILQAGSMA